MMTRLFIGRFQEVVASGWDLWTAAAPIWFHHRCLTLFNNTTHFVDPQMLKKKKKEKPDAKRISSLAKTQCRRTTTWPTAGGAAAEQLRGQFKRLFFQKD